MMLFPQETFEIILHQNIVKYLQLGVIADYLNYEQITNNCLIINSFLRALMNDVRRMGMTSFPPPYSPNDKAISTQMIYS